MSLSLISQIIRLVGTHGIAKNVEHYYPFETPGGVTLNLKKKFMGYIWNGL